jgi:hypothetical protein
MKLRTIFARMLTYSRRHGVEATRVFLWGNLGDYGLCEYIQIIMMMTQLYMLSDNWGNNNTQIVTLNLTESIMACDIPG